jgi:hypothetical protein
VHLLSPGVQKNTHTGFCDTKPRANGSRALASSPRGDGGLAVLTIRDAIRDPSTQAIAAGASVRERLGHGDVRGTLGTYVHTQSEQRRETTERIAARIFEE